MVSQPRGCAAVTAILLTLLPCTAVAQAPANQHGVPHISPQMQGIANARPVPVYTMAERSRAAQRMLRLPAPLTLGEPISLTPNAPYGRDGAHLSIWKPSFVLGTPSGGEVGVNFWGIHNEGHVNVGFNARTAQAYLLDCRLLSAGPITWKIFRGANESPGAHGELALDNDHFILLVPAATSDDIVSVELWPTPVTEMMGLLGCDLSTTVTTPH